MRKKSYESDTSFSSLLEDFEEDEGAGITEVSQENRTESVLSSPARTFSAMPSLQEQGVPKATGVSEASRTTRTVTSVSKGDLLLAERRACMNSELSSSACFFPPTLFRATLPNVMCVCGELSWPLSWLSFLQSRLRNNSPDQRRIRNQTSSLLLSSRKLSTTVIEESYSDWR